MCVIARVKVRAMAGEQVRGAADVRAGRERYVPRGIATTDFTVSRAEGATVWDVDGNEYLDFAGGIACQNLGHNPEAVVAAVHEQVDRYLHQCFMVGMYEPYIEVCRLLDEVWPGESETRSLLVNSGAEGIENAVKVARVATGRPAVLAFDHAFHGRTNLTMALTAKVVPYKDGFGPLAPEVYRAALDIDDVRRVFKQDVKPERVACIVLEPVQGEGGFIPMPEDFPRALKALCDEHGILYVDDEVQSGVGRTGPVWAIEHYGVEPDLLVSGKSLGGGLPLAGVTGKAELMDAVPPGGLGGTFGGTPLACAAAIVVLNEVRTLRFRARSEELGRRIRARLEALNAGEVRGLGPMLAVELPEQTPERASRITAAARQRGLVLLSAGMYGNVIRILVPLTIEDDLLERGLGLLEEAFGDADAA
jgi:4-aminobutyrate aminotransferase/(S)-3-amino-2-methylpropionate transaminase